MTFSPSSVIDSAEVDQTTYTSTTAIYPNKKYWWRVQAIDSDSNGLTWSTEEATFLRETPPLTLLSPVNNVSAPGTTAFRYRGNGWPGQATATLRDGNTRSMSYHDSWGKILSHHVQHRCKVCADGTGTAADLVCADAWVSDERGYPVFEERDGVSLIVTRNAKGEATAMVLGKDGKVAQKILTTGGTYGDKWLVTSGLVADDLVIVEGLQKIKAGAPARIAAAGPATAAAAAPQNAKSAP